MSLLVLPGGATSGYSRTAAVFRGAGGVPLRLPFREGTSLDASGLRVTGHRVAFTNVNVLSGRFSNPKQAKLTQHPRNTEWLASP